MPDAHTWRAPSPPIWPIDAARRIHHHGLTGGIGSGKSTVAAMLVDLGAVLVDTDAIARALTAAQGAALPALAAAFGSEVVGCDGALDRERMRERAFGDPAQKQVLEGILHPMITAEAARQAAAAGTQTVVFDVPLLTPTSPWRARVNRVLVVDCLASTQVARVMARNGWSAEMVQRVIGQQVPREQRRRLADSVIYNETLSLAELRAEVSAVWSTWTRVDTPVERGHTPPVKQS
jgi:dephospho-CoA kinase